MPKKSPDDKPTASRTTIEDIRAIEGYENLSDTEAEALRKSIQQVVSLLAHYTINQIEP